MIIIKNTFKRKTFRERAQLRKYDYNWWHYSGLLYRDAKTGHGKQNTSILNAEEKNAIGTMCVLFFINTYVYDPIGN